MRVTYHFGRGYGARHNDRNFNIENAKHIDAEKTKNENYTWHIYNDEELTFEQAEFKFYNETFKKALDSRNEKYIRTRNKKLIKTMHDYFTSRKTCPEDVIFSIGKRGDYVDKNILMNVFEEFILWQQEKFPRVQLLSAALHADEDGIVHIQYRQCYIGNDKNGNYCVSQSDALNRMHVRRIDENSKESRYNNSKITFTKICREKLQEIAMKNGFEIETDTKDKSEVGLSLIEYKTKREIEKSREIEKQINELLLQNKDLKDEYTKIKQNAKKLASSLNLIKTSNDVKSFYKAVQNLQMQLNTKLNINNETQR